MKQMSKKLAQELVKINVELRTLQEQVDDKDDIIRDLRMKHEKDISEMNEKMNKMVTIEELNQAKDEIHNLKQERSSMARQETCANQQISSETNETTSFIHEDKNQKATMFGMENIRMDAASYELQMVSAQSVMRLFDETSALLQSLSQNTDRSSCEKISMADLILKRKLRILLGSASTTDSCDLGPNLQKSKSNNVRQRTQGHILPINVEKHKVSGVEPCSRVFNKPQPESKSQASKKPRWHRK